MKLYQEENYAASRVASIFHLKKSRKGRSEDSADIFKVL